MNNVYILQNQNGFYLSKSGEWVSGEDSKALFRTEYKDEAINQKVELTVKQADLRVTVTTAKPGDKGKLIVSEVNAKENDQAQQKTDPEPNEQSLFGDFDSQESKWNTESIESSTAEVSLADLNMSADAQTNEDKPSTDENSHDNATTVRNDNTLGENISSDFALIETNDVRS